MKPYGITRRNLSETNCPCCNPLRGRKSRIGGKKGKGGDIRSTHKNAAAKARARRYWKRFARREGRLAADARVI